MYSHYKQVVTYVNFCLMITWKRKTFRRIWR